MRRITSLFMVVALVSVTSLPMLPEAAVCHAVEANATTENPTGTHDHHDTMMNRESPKHHDHDIKSPDQENIEQPKEMHKHQKQLSSSEKECRIECGCGCNHSMDGLPNLLSPHLTTITEFKLDKPTVRVEVKAFPERPSLVASVPSPPPKLI